MLTAAAVAGPSKRFCSHCCRALWACRPPFTARPVVYHPVQARAFRVRDDHSVRAVRPLSSSPRVAAKGGRYAVNKETINMDDFPPERIRNFSIIAHIDHGKSTLADRLLQMTNTLPSDSSPQFLDKLKVERERGITVKAQTVSIIHTHTDGQKYLINLIDTPGHVDFSYEVSRSLGACEGGLLLVDSTQGIQAQTLSVFYVALEADLTILGVINKIDLPHAEADQVSETMENTLGIEKRGHMRISAKSGIGVDEVLRQIVEVLPSPRKWEKDDGKLRGLVFDTYYDHFRGVVSLIRVMSGSVKVGDKIRFLQADRKYEVLEIGINNPDETPINILREGQVGYLVCSMKNYEEAHIGDTICHDSAIVDPLPGFKATKSMVFAGVFPTDSADFDKLQEAIERLTLNDRSVSVAKESSTALMQGFRLGFLGTLHMDVFKQRLEDEYSSEVIITNPTVPYRITKGGVSQIISNPCDFPDTLVGYKVEEPMIHSTIIVPVEYIGALMDLCAKYRSRQLEYKILETNRAILRYAFPLSEIVTDFFSALKSVSSGFASFDYEDVGYEESDLVKLNILLNGNAVDALSMIVHRSAAQSTGKEWCKKMKEVVPRQQFELAIQAAIGTKKVVARETIAAMRKDVTAGLYGGHFERKMKHLEKQKAGKKRLKRLAGNIDVPQSAFFTVLSRSYSTAATRSIPRADPPHLPSASKSGESRGRRSSAVQAPLDFGFQRPNVLMRSEESTGTTTDAEERFQKTRPLAKRSLDDGSKATGHRVEAIDLEITFPDDLPEVELPVISTRPLQVPTISPQLRSQHLSRLYALLDPIATPQPKEIYEAYTAILDLSSAHTLTPNELTLILKKLYASTQREGTDKVVARQYINDVNRALKRMIGETDVTRYHSMIMTPRAIKRPTPDSLTACENILTKIKGQISPKAVLFILQLGAAIPDKTRFERWWAEGEKIGLDHAKWGPRMALCDNMKEIDDLADILRMAVNEAQDDKKAMTALANQAMGIYARHGVWPMASAIYRDLTESTILFPGVGEVIPKDLDIKASRHTYSIFIAALCDSGYLREALQVMADMDTANHPPFILEYSSLFNGFARYGDIPHRSGRATSLFPPWLIQTVGAAARSDRTGSLVRWDGKRAYESDWTGSALESTFESLLTLTPGMRRVSTPYSRIDSYRAPNASVVYDIMCAFARTTGCDDVVLRKVWGKLDKKFSTGNRQHWRTETSTSKSSSGTALVEKGRDSWTTAAMDKELEIVSTVGRSQWKNWEPNGRMTRLIDDLDRLKDSSLPERERDNRSPMADLSPKNEMSGNYDLQDFFTRSSTGDDEM